MLNKVMIIGNLGADPETRFLQDGTCVCNLRVATTEKFKNREGEQQEKTEWHRLVLWGRLAEIANQYLTKGARIYIEGKIETRKWQDRDGNDKYTTEVRCHEMKMLGGGRDAGNKDAGQGDSSFPSHGGRQEQERKPADNEKGGANDPFKDHPAFDDVPVDSDIPF